MFHPEVAGTKINVFCDMIGRSPSRSPPTFRRPMFLLLSVSWWLLACVTVRPWRRIEYIPAKRGHLREIVASHSRRQYSSEPWFWELQIHHSLVDVTDVSDELCYYIMSVYEWISSTAESALSWLFANTKYKLRLKSVNTWRFLTKPIIIGLSRYVYWVVYW
jgi:hypothetical protein